MATSWPAGNEARESLPKNVIANRMTLARPTGSGRKLTHTAVAAMPTTAPAPTRAAARDAERLRMAGASPWRNPGSANARANSPAEANRSADTFSSAFRIAASTFAGTVGRCLVADTPSPAMIFPRIAWGVLPVYGGSPTSIS
jgi:hypothetical protein